MVRVLVRIMRSAETSSVGAKVVFFIFGKRNFRKANAQLPTAKSSWSAASPLGRMALPGIRVKDFSEFNGAEAAAGASLMNQAEEADREIRIPDMNVGPMTAAPQKPAAGLGERTEIFPYAGLSRPTEHLPRKRRTFDDLERSSYNKSPVHWPFQAGGLPRHTASHPFAPILFGFSGMRRKERKKRKKVKRDKHALFAFLAFFAAKTNGIRANGFDPR